MKEKKKSRIKNGDNILIPQEQDDYCICSILQAIFRKNKIFISQKDIADRLTPYKYGFISHDNKIRKLIESNGLLYEFYLRNQIPFNDIEYILYEMKIYHGFIGIGKHAYLFKDYKPPLVEIINPGNCQIELKHDSYISSNSIAFGLIKVPE